MPVLLRDDPTQKYVVFDFESCSLNLLQDNLPWSIAFLVYQNGKILERHEHFIKWDNLNISDGAAKVTRFDWGEYKRRAEDPNIVLDKFERLLNDKDIISLGQNVVGFDCYVLKIWREKLGRKNDYSYLDRTIDTNSLARAIKKGVKKIERKDWKLMMFRFANYRERGMKTSLTALGKEFGIDVNYDQLHDAGNDISLNAKVFDKLKYMIDI
jgi:DNA polymerase III epsilon subunit-like protein